MEFLGEESGLHAMKGETFWILDPIDGTTNLIHDYHHSTVSLALYDRGEIVMGIIYDPFREEMFYAQKGEGSFLNGRSIHVSSAEGLKDTIVAIGTAPYQKELAAENFRDFRECLKRVRISGGPDRLRWILPTQPVGGSAVILKRAFSRGILRQGFLSCPRREDALRVLTEAFRIRSDPESFLPPTEGFTKN